MKTIRIKPFQALNDDLVNSIGSLEGIEDLEITLKRNELEITYNEFFNIEQISDLGIDYKILPKYQASRLSKND